VKLRVLARWTIAAPLTLLLIDFALSNTEPVELRLFPLGELPFDMPLSVAILTAMGLGFFLGGLHIWITSLRHRWAARRAEEAMRLLEAKHQELRSRTGDPVLAPPV
jgi:uncharacterized integral membrane protein